jgi:DinB superfamily
VQPLDPILEKLTCAQSAFFRAADSVPAEQWNTKPKADEWSAAELVAHLVMVERTIIGSADRITQKRRNRFRS